MDDHCINRNYILKKKKGGQRDFYLPDPKKCEVIRSDTRSGYMRYRLLGQNDHPLHDIYIDIIHPSIPKPSIDTKKYHDIAHQLILQDFKILIVN